MWIEWLLLVSVFWSQGELTQYCEMYNTISQHVTTWAGEVKKDEKKREKLSREENLY